MPRHERVIESAVLAPEPDDALAQLPKRPKLVPGYIRLERFDHTAVADRREILVDVKCIACVEPAGITYATISPLYRHLPSSEIMEVSGGDMADGQGRDEDYSDSSYGLRHETANDRGVFLLVYGHPVEIAEKIREARGQSPHGPGPTSVELTVRELQDTWHRLTHNAIESCGRLSQLETRVNTFTDRAFRSSLNSDGSGSGSDSGPSGGLPGVTGRVADPPF